MVKLLSFNRILNNATKHYNSLTTAAQDHIKKTLSHGKALLDNNHQMKTYIHLYGEIHKEKLSLAFRNIPEEALRTALTVVDWGCGQGLASILFAEYLQEIGESSHSISEINLIEPSRHCLSQAVNYIRMCVPDTDVYPIYKAENNIQIKDVVSSSETIIHLLSNVIDMPEFEGNGIINYILQNSTKRNLIICVSPFYPEEGRGKRMHEFGERLNGFVRIFKFERHIDDWEQDYSCQIHIYDNLIDIN